MMDLYTQEKNCCGCTACKNVCPKNAICFVENSEGFLYPQIDSSLCIECGLCKKVCDFQNDNRDMHAVPTVYAAKHTDKQVINHSTSGGAFTAISDVILRENGVVYGVEIDENLHVKHGRAVNAKQRDAFCGSKYVQSDLSDIFEKVTEDLKNGKEVLFTGTPCQCAGLKSYLKTIHAPIDNLLLCDLVCHGTPSPLMWREHMASIRKKYKSSVAAYACRSKVAGWHSHTEVVLLENGKIRYQSPFVQKNKDIFYSHLALREACYSCPYTNIQRASDITIADFWGIEKTFADFDDNTGVSLLLLNTEKGKHVFHAIKSVLEWRQSDINACLQPQLQHPVSRPNNRQDFWADYYTHGYAYIIKKYTKCNAKAQSKAIFIKALQKLRLLDLVLLCKGRGRK